jgi:putative protease
VTAQHPALPELLAPTGSPEAFRAAVAAGADAVYLSGKRFGARKFAANFSDEEIEGAVKYAHAWGIRVYVTVNTLVHDRELAGAMDYLAWLYSLGVDAVLIQDTGLAALAHEHIPGLVLHASTQLTVHNADGVRWAHERGFSRVVLARELSLDEVKRIADETKDTGIGLEVFAHGALCYGYSGQCLLSSVIGGRSGNRGMCAQPCRKPYTLVHGETDELGRPQQLSDVPLKEKYLLSPKDLATYRHLPELVRSPVVSLKIEGRMKSPEYVAIVVSTYRKALDAIAAGRWKPSEEAYRDLLLAFNRGFTAGYLFKDQYERLIGHDAPDNRGLLIGRVERHDPRTATAWVRPAIRIVPVTGDGVLISHPEKPEFDRGFALNTTPREVRGGYTLPLPGPVPDGALVYITSSRELEARAKRIIAKPSPELLRPLPVDIDVIVSPEGSFRFNGTIARPDGREVPVTFVPMQRLEPARTHPLTRDQMEEQFRKTGGTPFVVRKCSITYEGNLFAPMALLNELRREFFRIAGEQLDAVSRPAPQQVGQARDRCEAATIPAAGIAPSPGARHTGQIRISVYADSVDAVKAAAGAGAGTVYFEPPLHAARHLCDGDVPGQSLRSQLAAAHDICKNAGTLFVWKLPRIVHDRELDQVMPELVSLRETGPVTCMSGNHGTSHAALRAVPDITLHGSVGLNIFNRIAATGGVPRYAILTLSPELSREEIATLTTLAGTDKDAPGFSLIVQGNSEALVTEDCISRIVRYCKPDGNETGKLPVNDFTGIRDETGRVFPIHCDGTCRTHIANAAELCLIDHLPAIRDAGITDIAIDARWRPPAYAGTIVPLYREALCVVQTKTGKARDEELGRLKERVKEIAIGGITAGHFIRGLRE